MGYIKVLISVSCDINGIWNECYNILILIKEKWVKYTTFVFAYEAWLETIGWDGFVKLRKKKTIIILSSLESDKKGGEGRGNRLYCLPLCARFKHSKDTFSQKTLAST